MKLVKVLGVERLSSNTVQTTSQPSKSQPSNNTAQTTSQPSNNKDPFLQLSNELVTFIFSMLSPKDRTNASLTCHHFRKIRNAGIRSLILNFHPIFPAEQKAALDKIALETILNYPRLKSLCLNCPDTSKITANDIIEFGPNCKNLTRLNLSQYRKITNAGLIAISQNCKNLTCLDLSGCSKITKAGLIAIGKNCPNLEILKLSYCDQITDDDIIEPSQNCKNLMCLDLSWCSKITKAGLIALSQNCKNLRYLWCTQITKAGLITLIKNCPNLTYLSLSQSCYGTDDFIREFKQTHPKLRIKIGL